MTLGSAQVFSLEPKNSVIWKHLYSTPWSNYLEQTWYEQTWYGHSKELGSQSLLPRTSVACPFWLTATCVLSLSCWCGPDPCTTDSRFVQTLDDGREYLLVGAREAHHINVLLGCGACHRGCLVQIIGASTVRGTSLGVRFWCPQSLRISTRRTPRL